MNVLIAVVVLVVIVAAALWLVGLLPFDPKAKQIIQAVVVVIALLYMVSLLLGYAPLPLLSQR